MARRGFLAEFQHQAQVAARERQRSQQAAAREHNAAVRRAEQARAAAARASAQLSRADEAERKRLEKDAREARIAAMEAEVEQRNLELAESYHDIDTLLAATLDVDDFVDLDTLRTTAVHPPFPRPDLSTPVPVPRAIPDLPEPVFIPPEPPKGLGGVFGKRKHAEAVALAEAAHQQAMREWRAESERLPTLRREALDRHARAEEERLKALDVERSSYARACARREADAAERNRRIDDLITNLGYGTVDAVQEYVSIVLSNSVYPEHFATTHDFTFDPLTAELRLRVLVPGPERLPEIKAYKYTKSTDEITATSLPKKACKDRYASAVHQVALRAMHEVFEADRRGLINTISLEVGTQTVDPATGRQTYVPFVAAGAEREPFLAFDLSAVVPASTLQYMGAAVSKNPYDLVPAGTSGVRRS